MTDIVTLGDKDVKEIAESVLAQLKSWPKEDNDVVITKGIKDLYNRLFDLPPGNDFFSKLEILQFKGALHCEIFLASLIHTTSTTDPSCNKYTEILSQLTVIILSLIHFLPNPYLFVMK